MADLFYTILIVWVLWRIFGSGRRHTVVHRHEYHPPEKKEGEVTVSQADQSSKSQDDNRGEYVDYEEVK